MTEQCRGASTSEIRPCANAITHTGVAADVSGGRPTSPRQDSGEIACAFESFGDMRRHSVVASAGTHPVELIGSMTIEAVDTRSIDGIGSAASAEVSEWRADVALLTTVDEGRSSIDCRNARPSPVAHFDMFGGRSHGRERLMVS